MVVLTAIQLVILFHVLLYTCDSLPLSHTLFSILCHTVYLQNFSNTWPVISLSSLSFIASCILAVTNHFIWFMYFSRLSSEARQSYSKYRGSVTEAPDFADIATFFGVCVWLVPLFLFLSLSANDNALPTSGMLRICLCHLSLFILLQACGVHQIRMDNERNHHSSSRCLAYFGRMGRRNLWTLIHQMVSLSHHRQLLLDSRVPL